MSMETSIPQNSANGIPAAMRAATRWVVRNGKVPHQARSPRYRASSTNPEHWTDYETAIAAVTRGDADGPGFVFADDGLVFIDLDNCFNDAGELKPYAAEIVATMPTHWHVSMSGKGLHGVCLGTIPAAVKTDAIEMYSNGRYMAIPADMRPYGDHNEIIDCQQVLDELWARYGTPERPTTSATQVSVSMDTRDVLERLQAQNDGGKAARLLRGDHAGFNGASEARFSLAGAAAFYTDNPDVITEVLLSSGLLDHHPDRDRERRARLDATNALESYSGPRYDPNYGKPIEVPNGPPPAEDDSAAAAYWKARALKAEQSNVVLRERVRRLDAREEVLLNTKLGAPRTTAAIVAQIIQDETPRQGPDADRPELSWRLPLKQLSERTGLSEGVCSGHLKTLATYRDLDGNPVFHVETFDIPRHTNPDTGEIIEPHKEIWGGPAGDPKDMMNVMASLAPKEAPKHGGDHGVCPDHPNAATIRRSKTQRKITRECAECHVILTSEIVDIGDERIEIIPAADPTQHDAGMAMSADPRPTQQDAVSTSTPQRGKQPSKMQGRSEPSKCMMVGCSKPAADGLAYCEQHWHDRNNPQEVAI